MLGIIVGVCATLAAAVLGYWLNRRLARYSRTLDRPDIRFHLFGQTLDAARAEKHSWCLLHPGAGHEPALFYLTFGIVNEGDGDAEENVFTITASRTCVIDERDSAVDMKAIPGVLAPAAKRSVVDIDGFRQISYILPSVRPRSGLSLTEGFIIRPSLPCPLPVASTSGGRAPVTIDLSLSYPLSLTFQMKGSPVVRIPLRIESIPAATVEEACEKYTSALDLERARRDCLASLSLVKIVRLCLTRKHRWRMVSFVKFEGASSLAIGDKRGYVVGEPPRDRTQICGLEYYLPLGDRRKR